jgi:fibronectin type 3 domain-containing protein
MTRLIAIAVAVTALGVMLPSSAPSAGQPAAPAGATAIALDHAIELAWQPVTGATSYNVYRGTSVGSATTLVSPAAGVATPSFTDTTAANGSSYFYAVRAVSAGSESADSLVVQSTPVPRACSTGNAIVLENCYPGNNPWNVRNTATIAAGGIEGYATSLSINRGSAVDLKVNSAPGTTFRTEIYRTGYYGGAGARLFSVITGIPGAAQPACTTDAATGLIDCSNWQTSLTLTTTLGWPSGVYAIRLVREDTGTDNQILLTVRDDSRRAQVVYGVAYAAFQAYNNYGGKSLYDFNSTGNTTVSGTTRAVKVSFDRPFEQPRSGLRDWYTRTEAATVTWLEQSGYDTSYISNTDLETTPTLISGVKSYISPSHDEYVSAAMRTSMSAARDSGVGLFFSGGNEVYWKVRFENGPSGGSNRVQVCYKTTQSGAADPSGIPTGTWRDPNGANEPENALTGVMYIGDNDNTYFPLVVSAVEGGDRVFRYTPIASQPAGASATLGNALVGWEWDARVANGREPAGLKTLASSPVTGELLQGNGATYNPSGSASVNVTKYVAPGGALVFATGTNHWNRGLALNAAGVGEPDSRIQQITVNVLADMGASPQTPAGTIVLDGGPVSRPDAPTGVAASTSGPDSTTVTWTAVPGADGYSVYRALAGRSDGQPLGSLASASLIAGTSFTDIGLSSATTYYYVVVATKGGVQSIASSEAATTTAAGAGQPTRLDSGASTSYVSTTGQSFASDTFVSGGSIRVVTTPVTGTNDPKLYQSERWGQFSYAIPVANGTYDVRFHFAETYYGVVTAAPCVGKRIFGMDIVDTATSPDLANVDICAAAGPGTAYVRTVPNVTVADGVLNVKSVLGTIDDPELTALEVIPRAIASPTVTSTAPLSSEQEVPVSTFPRATFSRSMAVSTISSSTVTLSGPGGAVPAAVSFDSASRTATLSPAATLSFSTTYTVALASSIKAADGAPLGTTYSWQFTTQAPPPPDVAATSPDDAAEGVSPNGAVRANFTRSLDPTTVTSSSFTLRDSLGALVPAVVSYDTSALQATLHPTAALTLGGTYTARLSTAVTTADGVAMAAPYVWSFTVATAAPGPVILTGYTPNGSALVSTAAAPTVTFSRAIDASTLTSSTITLSSGSGSVTGSISYDATTLTATFTPTAALAPSTTYTLAVTTGVAAADGTPFSGGSFGFTTVDGPTVVSVSPSAGVASVDRSTAVNVVFSRSMAPGSITSSTFALFAPDGSIVPAAVTYDAASLTASLKPASMLVGATTYAARIGRSATSADGTPIGTDTTWKFTTSTCPCSLFLDPVAPLQQNLPTRDGRAGTGPWTYELGLKIRVDQAMRLNAIRFWKSSSEIGTHVANLWTSTGMLLASTTATGETASGWQTASFAAPPLLQAGTTYIASVNANSFYNVTSNGLASLLVSGPLRSVADGSNGVFGSSAGVFPNQTYRSTNYFTDVIVVPDGDSPSPVVTSNTPAANAANVDANLPLKATFSRPMNPTTITASSFNVRSHGTSGGTDAGGAVDATVAYDDSTNTATLTPSAPLTHGVTYVATLDTAIRAQDGKPLAAPVTWTFNVAAPPPPVTVAASPGNAATAVNTDVGVKLVFNRTVDAATLTAATTYITAPDGTVVPATISYDAFAFTETIQPTAKLAINTTYTVNAGTGVRAPDGTSILNPYSSTFTTGTCPCTLMTGLTPTTIGAPVQDGRSGAGPWSYELGTKFSVDQPATLASVRWWKDVKETGSHTARVWTASGTLIATLPFATQTASGWQQANFATPLQLAANTVYVVSININAFFVTARSGLATPRTAGIARTPNDIRNGIYGSSAGVFPTNSFSSTNYFVDVVVR